MGALSGIGKDFGGRKTGFGKDVGTISKTTDDAKGSIDTAQQKQARLKYRRYQKNELEKYNKQRNEEIDNVLNTLKTDFDADDVSREGNIIKVKKGIEEYQFEIGDSSIDYKNKIFNIPDNMVRQGSSILQTPKTYTSFYRRDDDDKDVEKADYIPYEVILDDKGNIKSEIWRDDYNEYESRSDDRKVERNKVYIKKRKDYDSKGNLISERAWDDYTKYKKKRGDKRYEKADVFLEEEKLYENGFLVREREWDDYKDEYDKYSDGYKYGYDTYLRKDKDYKKGIITGDSPDRMKVKDYALQDKIANYKYKDPYIKIMEDQKKALTPEAQKRFDQNITQLKIKEINKEFGTKLTNPYIQVSKPGESVEFNKNDALKTLDIVSYVGSKNPVNIKQMVYSQPNKQKNVFEFDTSKKNIIGSAPNFQSFNLNKQSVLPKSNNMFSNQQSILPKRNNNLGFSTSNSLIFGQSNNQSWMPKSNNNQSLMPESIKNQKLPTSMDNISNVFGESSKQSILRKIF